VFRIALLVAVLVLWLTAGAQAQLFPQLRQHAIGQCTVAGSNPYTCTPPAFGSNVIVGDGLLCVISFNDAVRGQVVAANTPTGWTLQSLTAAPVSQAQLVANFSPEATPYWQVATSTSPTLPAFSVTMNTGSAAPQMGYDCGESEYGSTTVPFAQFMLSNGSGFGGLYPLVNGSTAGAYISANTLIASATAPPRYTSGGIANGTVSTYSGAFGTTDFAASSTLLATNPVDGVVTIVPTPNPMATNAAGITIPLRQQTLLVTLNPVGATGGPFVTLTPEWSEMWQDDVCAINVRPSSSNYTTPTTSVWVPLIESLFGTVGTNTWACQHPHFSSYDTTYNSLSTGSLSFPLQVQPLLNAFPTGDIYMLTNACDAESLIQNRGGFAGAQLRAINYPNEIDGQASGVFNCTGEGGLNYGSWQGWLNQSTGRIGDIFNQSRILGVKMTSPTFQPVSVYDFGINSQSQPGANWLGVGDTTAFQDVIDFHSYGGGSGPLDTVNNAYQGCGKFSQPWADKCYAQAQNLNGDQPFTYGERNIQNNSAEPEANYAAYLPIDELIRHVWGASLVYTFQEMDGAGGSFVCSGLVYYASSPPDTCNGASASNDLPRPAFFALNTLVQELADNVQVYVPTKPVSVELTTQTVSGGACTATAVSEPNLYAAVEVKHDGSYEVVFGDGSQTWNPNSQTQTPITPYCVTITLPFNPVSPTLDRQDGTTTDTLLTSGSCTIPASSNDYGCALPPLSLTFVNNGNGTYSSQVLYTTSQPNTLISYAHLAPASTSPTSWGMFP
jgi:hypothetical protein